MALDKLVDSAQLDSDIASVANAIRTKGGTSAQLAFPQGFVDAVEAIPTGGGGFDFADKAWPTGTIVTAQTSIFRGCFGQRTGITRIEAPNATSASDEAFRACTGLESVYLPNLQTVETYAFNSCTSLVGLVLPKLKLISQNFANGCSNLVYVDFGDLTGKSTPLHQGDAFQSCTKFSVLIIRKTSLVPIPNVNSFNGTPFASGGTGGTLYVPSALISSYQSATNWSTLLGYANNSIQAIEGSQYENYYADGTPIT